MTLLETIRIIERVAASQPSVNMIVENDVFKLNACPDALYGVFAFVQGQHSGSVDSDFLRFSFSLFYIDRLIEDKRNQLEVQSVAASTLDNILRELNEEGIGVSDYTLQPFNQRFADDCAGMWATVTLSVLAASTCPGTWSDTTIKII